MTVFKGKSFKVGWDKGFQFYSINGNDTKGSLSVNIVDCGSKKKVDPLEVQFIYIEL